MQVPEIVGEMRCKNSVKFQFVPARHQKIGRKVKKMNKKSIKNKKKQKKFFLRLIQTLVIPNYKHNRNVSFKSEFALPEPKKIKKRPPSSVQTYSLASGHHMEAI